MGISRKEIKKLDGYYRALNYLSVGQLYLLDNPILESDLILENVKSKAIGHFGTVPAQNLVYAHLNRIIKKYDLNMIYISGPGHGGNAPTSGAYLDGTITDKYSDITLDKKGLQKLFKRFSFPGGVGSHATPELPGSIHEGGELGYSLAHAFGAVLDNPSLIAATVIGDGEAETGSLATSWNFNHFLSPESDGVILPIINLNGHKINNPSLLSCKTEEELYYYFKSMGYEPYFVTGNKSLDLHKKMANTLDKVVKEIKKIKSFDKIQEVRYPVIILTTPKGMTGPKALVGTSDAHQIPFQVNDEASLKRLENWLKSYKPNELFGNDGKLKNTYQELIPELKKTMSYNVHTNGGKFNKDLILPDLNNFELKITKDEDVIASDMMHLGNYLKEVFKKNDKHSNFRIFGPDEAMSNRLNHVFEFTNKTWNTYNKSNNPMLKSEGRVLDGILSENFCEGAMEGYALTGRYGIMNSYEAFINVSASMTNQHAKWLKMCSEISWRKDIPSINYLLSSHVWQQDHNGYTHQDPSFISNIMNKKSKILNLLFPVDANTLVASVDSVLNQKNKINTIVASKHPSLQFFDMKSAQVLVKNGVQEIDFVSSELSKPDVILACCGDTPTKEMFIAAKILKEQTNIKFKVINILDLIKFKNLSLEEFEKLFTKNKKVIFSFHGYPSLIKSLTCGKHNNFEVYGYEEEGTITTPFNMRVLNKIDRFNIILNVLETQKKEYPELKNYCKKILDDNKRYIEDYGVDLDEIVNFKFYSNKSNDKN